MRQTWDRYATLDTPQPMIDFTARWLLDHLPRDFAPTLVRNDFRNGNIMVSRDGVVAVLEELVQIQPRSRIGSPM